MSHSHHLSPIYFATFNNECESENTPKEIVESMETTNNSESIAIPEKEMVNKGKEHETFYAKCYFEKDY